MIRGGRKCSEESILRDSSFRFTTFRVTEHLEIKKTKNLNI